MKHVYSLIFVMLISLLLLCGCAKPREISSEDNRKAVIALLQTKVEAAHELNIVKYLSPYNQSPEFVAFINGSYFDYDSFCEVCSAGIRPMKRYDFSLDTIYTRSFSPDIVAAFAPFRELLVDSSGIEQHMKGKASWIAQRIDGNWKFIYADITVGSAPSTK